MARGAKANHAQAAKDYAYLVHLIRNLHEQRMSIRAIAAHLAELGETTGNGAAFTAATVKRILDRRA